MRVLMVVRQFYPVIGGTEKQAQKLSARLIEFGIDVRLVTGWWAWGTPREETIDTVPVFRNFTCWNMFGLRGLRKFGGYIYILSLFWYLWRHRSEYDLIHVHLLNYPAFPAVLAGQWLGKKTIIKVANSQQDSDIRRMQRNEMFPGQRQMLPVTLKADKIVAINSKIIDELREVGVPLEQIGAIPNGVELNGLNVKDDYSLNDTVTVIFSGRLHPQKGLTVLLVAFKQVLDRRPDIKWRLWLLGDGELRSQLESMAQQLGITQAVTFWGQVDNVATYLEQADIFVLPSRAEGLSNALLEAMAWGLPCIVTCIDGNTDLVRHNENGLLINPGSESDLAEALIRLVDDERLRQRVGRLARRTIEDNYSLDMIARRYIELYKVLLKQ